MIYELRTYVPNPGRLQRLLARFETDSIAIMARHGIEGVGHWLTRDDEPSFVYLVRHRDDPAQTWAAFYADPDWVAIAAEADRVGRSVATIESVFLEALPFSPLGDHPFSPPSA